MPFGKHIVDIRQLMELGRYQNRFMFKRRSVAAHMWSVAKIAQGLAIWEEQKFDHPVDMGRLLEKAINHDVIEMRTGDILATTKKRTKVMQEALEEIEHIAYEEEIKQDLPKSWQERFKPLILDPKTDDIEGQIIAAADIIDTILEAREEVKLGNDDFKDVLVYSVNALITIDLDCVRYFVKFSLLDFDLDYREFYGDAVADFAESISFSEEVFEK